MDFTATMPTPGLTADLVQRHAPGEFLASCHRFSLHLKPGVAVLEYLPPGAAAVLALHVSIGAAAPAAATPATGPADGTPER